MSVDFLLERFAENPYREAIVWRNRAYGYRWLLARIHDWNSKLEMHDIRRQAVVMLEGDYSPNALALMLALVRHGCIIVPLKKESRVRRTEYAEVVQAEILATVSLDDEIEFQRLDHDGAHPFYRKLRDEGHAALVLFSSGSAGRSKAAVHDFPRLLEKYRTRRRDLRTLTFLLYDHIGGVDTLFYSLSNASCLVTVADRLPETVCAAIQDHSVEVLPVSPSFLNLLLLSQAYERYDLRSLKVITYGAEVMPESTLRRCHKLFPDVQLLQKFGTTEVGTLRSRSKAPDSTWVQIGGEGYQVRVVDGILQIKARSAILGYLNAPTPFTQDGWFVTGDLVEVDGDYLRILGRQTDIINVGGEKVNPAEVENVIQELDVVHEVSVYGELNAILGNVICANVSLAGSDEPRAVVKRIKSHCRGRLERYKVPLKINIVGNKLHTDRFKKARRRIAEG